MKKYLKQIVSLFGVSLVGSTAVLPTLYVHAEESELEASSLVEELKNAYYTEEAIEQFEKTYNLIQKAKESGTLSDIRNAYGAFIKLTPHLNAQNFHAYQEYDPMDGVYFETISLLYHFVPENQLDKEILLFAEAWKDMLVENPNSIYVAHYRLFVQSNPIESIQNKLSEFVEEVNRYANGIYGEDGLIPLPTIEELERIREEYEDKFGPIIPVPEQPTDEEVQNEVDQKYPQKNPSNTEIVGKSIHYEKINGKWYEIIDTIVNGKKTKTERRMLSTQEAYYLELRHNPHLYSSSSNNRVQVVTDQQWAYYTSDQNPLSKWTIHYTVNKDEATPYYYDTGIRVNENKEATYEQFKDVLLIIAGKMDGHLVEDKGKILVVVEGKPIVVYDSKETYSKKELETLFEEFEKVDIRIMETSIGKAGSLEEQIVSKQVKTVRIDGKEIALDTLPIVKNERALLPLEEIVYALGGKMTTSNNTYHATKNGNNVIFRSNDKLVYVNGKRITMNNAPVYEDGVLMAEVSSLATAFGYNMVWDSDTSTITFEKR